MTSKTNSTDTDTQIAELKAKASRLRFKLNAANLLIEDLQADHTALWVEKYRDRYPLSTPDEEVMSHIAYRRGTEIAPGVAQLIAGYLAVRRLGRLLAEEGVEDLRSILDFGCGFGRLTRFFDLLGEDVQCHGCDIDGEAIGWAQEHLGDKAEYFVSPDSPPFASGPEGLGAILVLSVFTHLPEDMQFAWLEELASRLAPGGLMFATYHGKSFHRFIPEADRAEFRRQGFVHSDLGKTPSLPDYYLSTFHSDEYIETNWNRGGLKLRRLVPQGLNGQDLAILERV